MLGRQCYCAPGELMTIRIVAAMHHDVTTRDVVDP
jgi:hypothetical protein